MKKSLSKKCEIKYCRRIANHGRLCATCYARRWRLKNPIRYALNTLRANAKRRGKEFTITFKQFFEWPDVERYIQEKGQTPTSLSIDRKKNEHGYHIWNIQTITLSANSHKRNKSMREAYARGWISHNPVPG